MSLSTFEKDRTLWVCGFLILSLLFVFGPVVRHEFVNYDDPLYITQNETVLQGLTWASVKWAMTAVVTANWHPLTMLSHLLDVELFGLNAGLHHLVNVLFHMANALLVFYLLQRMTGAGWRSALVAVLFALHPLRVESVAWASERKDVLCALFWLLTTVAYLRYIDRKSVGRYAATAALFALALMAKPMAVTLPFALLLLDYWPLGRIDTTPDVEKMRRLRQLAAEKLPLFALAAIAAGVSVFTQHATGAMISLERTPLGVRLANACVSYGFYLLKTVAPHGLALIYPYPGAGVPAWQVILSAAVVLAITLLTLYAWKTHPYAAVGWFWFLGVLVPVLGLVQVGEAARADRYTYIPHIGLFVGLVWLVGAIVESRPVLKRPVLSLIAVIILAMTVATYVQVSYWRNNVTLFTHNIEVAPNSDKAHFLLGIGYVLRQDPARAEPEFRRALEINPDKLDARKNLAAALVDLGRPDEAEAYFLDIIQLAPYEPEYHVNLAIALFRQGKYAEAIFRAEEALRIDPEYARALEVIKKCNQSIEPEIEL